ncbi:MAG: hypothetical protein LBI84_01180 [Propionibacteriaceae bacterium]|jgi:hypothetical protein|nr:hypothetical protein [Propionibacteriaceae bacterium]
MARRLRQSTYAVFLAIVTAVSLTACSGDDGLKSNSTIEASEDSALQEANEKWESAYAAAESSWQSLQDVIIAANVRAEEFKTLTIKTPDALTAFKARLADAAALVSSHRTIQKPNNINAITENAGKLDEIAAGYDKTSQELVAALGVVETADPARAEYSFTTRDGYSYKVAYAMNASLTVDTTEGAPGTVALYLDVSDCSVTVTNTTAGKKAPGVAFSDITPLYDVALLSDVVDGISSEFATYGPLRRPIAVSEKLNLGAAKDIGFDPIYTNPFDNDPDLDDGYSHLGNLVPQTGWGDLGLQTIRNSAEEYGVGETKEYSIAFHPSDQFFGYGNNVQRVKIGEIAAVYVDRFMAVSAWLVLPSLRGGYSEDTTLVFAGAQNKSSDLGDDWVFSPYNPIVSS